MRILLTTDTIGGVWTFTTELATGLLEREHSVALVSFGGPPSREHMAWASSMRALYGGSFRYDAFDTPLEWMPVNRNCYAEPEPLLLRVADEFAPHLLHSNQFCFGCLPLPVPRILTAHSDVLSWSDACRPPGPHSPNPASPVGFDPAWLAQYRRLVQHGLHGASFVVAPTRSMLDALARHFKIPCATRVILNGRTLPAAPHNQSRALQAVSAGRLWDEAKNLSILAGVRSPFPILVAGASHRPGAASPALPASVTPLGPLDQHDLLALFRRSSIYLATSIYEPFGLAPLEAALCGCAVLANDIPSLREVWGDDALYFTSAGALERLLAQLHASPAMLERAMRCSNRRALELTRSRMVEDYLALYHHALSAQLTPAAAYGPAAYA